MYSTLDHTFVLCAYKEGSFLEECLDSLKKQTVKTNILVATATPNKHIEEACRTYNVPLFINSAPPGIATDWNFAMSCATTSLVTIAHQDDTYEPDYVKKMLLAVNSVRKPLIFFSNYGELREGVIVDNNRLLTVKRFLLAPLKFSALQNSRFIRRRVLSLGSAICCPAVTMVTPHLPEPLFLNNLKCNLDWQTWERVSRLEGSFLYDPSILMHHRIHGESETTALIENNTRTEEDMYMFEQFWPRPIALIIGKLYSISQKSNG